MYLGIGGSLAWGLLGLVNQLSSPHNVAVCFRSSAKLLTFSSVVTCNASGHGSLKDTYIYGDILPLHHTLHSRTKLLKTSESNCFFRGQSEASMFKTHRHLLKPYITGRSLQGHKVWLLHVYKFHVVPKQLDIHIRQTYVTFEEDTEIFTFILYIQSFLIFGKHSQVTLHNSSSWLTWMFLTWTFVNGL